MANERTLGGADEATRKELHDIVEALNKVDLSTSSGKELEQKVLATLQRLDDGMASRGPTSGRQGQFDVQVATRDLEDPEVTKAMLDLRRDTPVGESDEITRSFQTMNDEMYLLGSILKKQNPWLETKRGRAHIKTMLKMGLIRDEKAFDTSATAGGPYIPTGFSALLHEQVRLALRVAALHERITMPTDPYKLPIEGLDATAYLVSEQGNSDAYLTAGNAVTASYSTGSAAVTPGLSNLTLTSRKLGSRVTFSAEVDEDSIIPIFPYVNRKVVLSMADSQEDATINGDTAGTHQDGDVTSSADARKAWDGYRKAVQSAAKIDAQGTAGASGLTTTIDVANLRNVRLNMGKYGIDPSKLTIITGPVGYIKLLGLKDGTNPSPVMTLDKYGPQATILTGEMARVDGIPVLISSKVREDLGSTTPVQTGGTVDRTMVLVVNRDAFVYGDRRQASVKSRDIIETDQTTLVIMQRLTFANWFTGQGVAGFVWNIKK